MTTGWFIAADGTRLFYRAWLPEGPVTEAVLLFHRGHEHSGRFAELALRLARPGRALFAYDARGHGESPGDRGWAPSFATLVRDAQSFADFVSAQYAVPLSRMAVLAHSIGAVVAAAWVHDYAPPLRAMVLASPAFRVKLYVPFALAFLRLRLKLQPKAFVKSYVRPSMLTHDPAERQSYARDPLIARSVAVNLLVQMHDTATRLIADAGSIRVPCLLLSSGADYVVKPAAQRDFFSRLGSPVKRFEEFPGFYHDLLHESGRERVFASARAFLDDAFASGPAAAAEIVPANLAQYERLSRPPALAPRLLWSAQSLFLRTIGRLSRGIRLGWQHGFDSGESLDYVYRNRAQGAALLGRLIDRIYLDSPGWQGIRRRKLHVQEFLREAIADQRARGRDVRIFDPAAGSARYILETVDPAVAVSLRDWSESNVQAAGRLARELRLTVDVSRGDAFDRESLAAIQPRPSIVVVSGLYELFPDNARVGQSLLGIAAALPEEGYLIYTNQPWHPQLEMIARVLRNREGRPWIMRCRAQAEMDALVRAAGFEKLRTLLDDDGIFTVSLARRTAPSGVPAAVAGAVLRGTLSEC